MALVTAQWAGLAVAAAAHVPPIHAPTTPTHTPVATGQRHLQNADKYATELSILETKIKIKQIKQRPPFTL